MSYIPSSTASTALKELLRDANANAAANNFLAGYTTTATSGGTKTLDAGSTSQQFFTGTTTHTVVLPITSTLVLGQQFQIVNNSTGTVTVQSSGANNILLMPGSSVANFTCISLSGTGISSWFAQNLTSGATLTPTIQTFTSGTAQTYTTPANVAYLRVRMVGAGGGGGGSGTVSSMGNGTSGTDSTFGTSLLTAKGGTSATQNSVVGAGGAAGTINSPAFGTKLAGGSGTGGANYSGSALPGSEQIPGGMGGSTIFGCGGIGNSTAGLSPNGANTGAGGGGGGVQGANNVYIGAGGGAGSYIEAIIPAPSATYTYTVGTKGTGATTGTSGFAGGDGADGYIEVTEYYLNATLGNGGLITPTIQKFTSSSGNYTTPTNVAFIHVKAVGGGGKGSGSGTGSATDGSAGAATTFGSQLSAGGGSGGIFGGAGGGGGTSSLGTGPIGTSSTGGTGFAGSAAAASGYRMPGGLGGTAPGFASGGSISDYAGAGAAGGANSGGGGQGGGNNATTNVISGSGGGSGGVVDSIIIPTSGQVFAYVVGAGGSTNGAAGTSGFAGGNGGSGYIEVTEYYNNGAIGTATNVTGIVAVANGGTGKASTSNASYQMATAQTLTSTAIIKFDTLIIDSSSEYNISTGIFTSLTGGTYAVSMQLFSLTATTAWEVQVRKNSSAVTRKQAQPVYSGGTSNINNQSYVTIPVVLVNLAVNGTIDFYNDTAIGTGTIYASTIDNFMSIVRVGP